MCPVFFCQFFLFLLDDSPSKIIKNVFLFHCKSSFCSGDIEIFVTFSRVASDVWNLYKGIGFKKINHEKDEQSFLWNLKSKIQEHFKSKSLKTHYFKYFSRTTYNSRTIQGIKGTQELLATLFSLPFHTFQIQKDK